MQYLTDLECPFTHDAAFGTSKEVKDWLLHYAVDLAYEDLGNLSAYAPCRSAPPPELVQADDARSHPSLSTAAACTQHSVRSCKRNACHAAEDIDKQQSSGPPSREAAAPAKSTALSGGARLHLYKPFDRPIMSLFQHCKL